MSGKKKIVVLSARKPQGCDLCGKVAELRPYGPNGEWICFTCGMKDEESTKRQFAKRLENPDPRLGDSKP